MDSLCLGYKLKYLIIHTVFTGQTCLRRHWAVSLYRFAGGAQEYYCQIKKRDIFID